MAALMFDRIISDLGVGLATALSLSNLFHCFVGVLLGKFIGVLPGIGALTALSLLLPVTFHLEPTSAIIMLAGVYYGTTYGGSVSSILLNLPGEPSTAVTCLEGYPMARQGRAGVALLMTAIASFFGASIGIIIMTIFSPMVVAFALEFGPAEYFSMMILGVVAASSISAGSPVKGIAMVVVGIILGLVGADTETGTLRFTFDTPELFDGISLIAITMGLFGLSEVIASIGQTERTLVDRKRITFRSMVPTRDDVRRSWLPVMRGTSVGSFLGALPGTGPVLASFKSYAIEREIARDPSRFGNGAIEGIMAPESANNAAQQTAFIPTMTLGIPGSTVQALMIGALMIHGIVPGPRLMVEQPELFWGLVMSFWVGNVMLLFLSIPMIGIWMRLLSIPYHLLYPAILMFVCMGIFSVNQNSFDVVVAALFGALGYATRLLDFHIAPLLLGFVLGPLVEENFRRALLLADGNVLVFFVSPISAVFMALTAMLLAWTIFRAGYRTYRARTSMASR
jgi:TctA family transporter